MLARLETRSHHACPCGCIHSRVKSTESILSGCDQLSPSRHATRSAQAAPAPHPAKTKSSSSTAVITLQSACGTSVWRTCRRCPKKRTGRQPTCFCPRKTATRKPSAKLKNTKAKRRTAKSDTCSPSLSSENQKWPSHISGAGQANVYATRRLIVLSHMLAALLAATILCIDELFHGVAVCVNKHDAKFIGAMMPF